MSLILTDVQKVSLSIQPVDAAGNPAKVDGLPEWQSSDPTVLSLTVAADGLSAEVMTLGPLGTCQISVSADADMGTGVHSITGLLDVEVVASDAVSVAVTAGIPESRI